MHRILPQEPESVTTRREWLKLAATTGLTLAIVAIGIWRVSASEHQSGLPALGGIAEQPSRHATPEAIPATPGINIVTRTIFVASSAEDAENFRAFLHGIYTAMSSAGKAP